MLGLADLLEGALFLLDLLLDLLDAFDGLEQLGLTVGEFGFAGFYFELQCVVFFIGGDNREARFVLLQIDLAGFDLEL